MRVFALASLLAVSVCLAGCNSFGGVSVGKSYVGYENDNYKVLVEKVADPTQPKQIHVRTSVDPKQGQKTPNITGDIQNTVSGGKVANIYINPN